MASLYDPLGAVREIAIGGHAPLRFSSDALGREIGRESATGFRLEQGWDTVGQLVRQTGGRGQAGLASQAPLLELDRAYAWARDFSPRAIADTRWGETTYETDAAGQVVRTR
ncbi:hypothetical protein, partial [Methylobacterium sp. Leaf100]|uniref:hypothetical protein n=1 Tax=Methylobacterium sp. Leaf100 TaxID=1736252 RepID=UPI0012E3032C